MTRIRNTLVAGAVGAGVLGAVAFQGDAAPVRCALLVDGALERVQIFDGSCPANPKGKPAFKWLSAPKGTAPAFNPATQVRTRNVPTVGVSDVTETWTVRAKTARELNADETETVNRINRAVLRVLYRLESHDRVSDGRTALTNAQCAAAFKGLL